MWQTRIKVACPEPMSVGRPGTRKICMSCAVHSKELVLDRNVSLANHRPSHSFLKCVVAWQFSRVIMASMVGVEGERNEQINLVHARPFQGNCELTFSPKTKKGDGNVCSLLEQFTEDLWINAALPSVVKTLRFSRWTHTLGYKPRQSSATTYGTNKHNITSNGVGGTWDSLFRKSS